MSESMNYGRWYGFDLDGTIADNSAHTFGFGTIGAPIVPMTDLMRRLHQEGQRVKIFTARLSDVGKDAKCRAQVREHIWKWCDENLGFRPEVTDVKDFQMVALYDDRAKQVVRNVGITYEELVRDLVGCLRGFMEAHTKSNGKVSEDLLLASTAILGRCP